MAKAEKMRASQEQRLAWGYYGNPTPTIGSGVTASRSSIETRVGEVRYVIGWMADQIVRMGWRITKDGSEDWNILGPGGEPVVSDSDEADLDSPRHPVNASATLLAQVGWGSTIVREVTTNLFVAGELHYVSTEQSGGKGKWQVVSVIHPDRESILSSSPVTVRGLWPHPANPDAPDAPLFGVLDILDDMAWLSRLSRSQSANRVGMRGIIGVSDNMTTASGASGEQFWDDFQTSLSRPMEDPTDVSPVGLRGPTDLVKPEGNGMGGLSWIIPEYPYDDKIDARMEKLVKRLAYGLPIPPEILLGMQAQSKATAFQVEGATYRAHIEPAALLVAQVATDALRAILEVEGTISVVPDPTQILARRHSVQDVLEAFDRGAVGFDYLREVLGIPARAEPTEADIELRLQIDGKTQVMEGVRDPAQEAASEPIAAAARMPGQDSDSASPGRESADDAYLSATLARIDENILAELAGASAQAVSRAREKLGAAVRSKKGASAQIPAKLTNEEVATQVGRESLEALGVNVAQTIEGATEPLLTWWAKRLAETRLSVAKLLLEGDVTPDFTEQGFNRSLGLLSLAISEAVFSDLPTNPEALRAVVNSGGS